jgi:putative transposase
VQGRVNELFGNGQTKDHQEAEAVQAKLYEEVGRLKMELDWLKKLPDSVEYKRQWVVPGHSQLSIRRQCALLGLGRANWYYQPAAESTETLELMRQIDRQYTCTPFYGSRRMTVFLNAAGYPVNRKRVQRLMRQMGLVGVAPGPQTSRPQPQHTVSPYLLRGLVSDRPNQAWCTAVTYRPMPRGFLFLVAILDWYSRYVVAWMVSNTQDTAFCLETLEQAFTHGCPAIFNSDQGCQFTSTVFTTRLEAAGVQASMDGRGRVFDNIFIERLWRTMKYEYWYLADHRDGLEVEHGLRTYFQFYNTERPHQALGYRTPEHVHFGKTPTA